MPVLLLVGWPWYEAELLATGWCEKAATRSRARANATVTGGVGGMAHPCVHLGYGTLVAPTPHATTPRSGDDWVSDYWTLAHAKPVQICLADVTSHCCANLACCLPCSWCPSRTGCRRCRSRGATPLTMPCAQVRPPYASSAQVQRNNRRWHLGVSVGGQTNAT